MKKSKIFKILYLMIKYKISYKNALSIYEFYKLMNK
jgi:hypothetical protein